MAVREIFAGVDVGGTYVRMGLVGPGGLLRESQVPTASLSGTEGTPGLILEAVAGFIGTDLPKVAALCLGFPSVVSKDRRVVLQTPNVPGLDNVPMADLAEAAFPFPTFIEKDVNLLLRHDLESLGLMGRDPVLAFYIGTGLGNAISIGGKFFTGARGAAGELGHIQARGNEARCSCGNTGCIEMIASGKALAAHVALDHPDCPVGEYFVRHGGSDWAQDFVSLLAMAIATEMNILDPEAAILGGGVLHMAGFPRQPLLDGVRQRLRPPFPRESAILVFSEQGRNPGVLGAAAYARDRLLKP